MGLEKNYRRRPVDTSSTAVWDTAVVALLVHRVYSVGPLQLAGHFDVLDGSNGSCGQGNGGWTNQVNFWAIFFQMENLMGNWCKILAKLC